MKSNNVRFLKRKLSKIYRSNMYTNFTLCRRLAAMMSQQHEFLFRRRKNKTFADLLQFHLHTFHVYTRYYYVTTLEPYMIEWSSTSVIVQCTLVPQYLWSMSLKHGEGSRQICESKLKDLTLLNCYLDQLYLYLYIYIFIHIYVYV